MRRFFLALCLILTAAPALAQDPAEEASFFTQLLENRLSTPNRQIRIRGIQGALSSEATIDEITVADREGVWLRISNAQIDWSRSTLLLRQRLEVERLAAGEIQVLRQPLPDEDLPAPEATPLQVPELPIAVNLENLEIERLAFDEDVFGLQSVLTVEGSLAIEGGSLDTSLSIVRLDGPGGRLTLDAQYANETQQLDIDVALREPENGVLANLLDIEGRPPLALTLAGSGPIDQLDLNMTLAADGAPVLEGTGRFRQRAGGLGFNVDVGGPIARIVPERFRPFFGEDTRLQASGMAKEAGGVLLENLTLSSAALSLEAAAETASDGFLTSLSVDAEIGDDDAEAVLLPVAGGETSVRRATLSATYGEGGNQRWQAALNLYDLQTGAFAAETATLDMSGIAENLQTPAERHITYEIDGTVAGITAERADIAEALGDTVRLRADGGWTAGQPFTIADAQLSGNDLGISLAGDVADFAFRGDIGVEAASIAPFSGFAGRELAGGLDLQATGEVRPISGAFDLVLDGVGEDLRLGIEQIAPLLEGETRISGRIARGPEGIVADGFTIANDQLTLRADGTYASDAADIRLNGGVADLSLIDERLSGRLLVEGSAMGGAEGLSLNLISRIEDGSLLGKPLTDASLEFDGMRQDSALTGRLTGDAFLDGARVELQTDIVLAAGEKRLNGIDFRAGGARLRGDIAQDREGMLTGELELDAPNISTAAALALVEATGSANARITLQPRGETQHATINGIIRDLESDRLSVGVADIEAEIGNLFSVPRVEGALHAEDLTAAGVEVAVLNATADTQASQTEFDLDARLAHGTQIDVAGLLAPQDGGYRLRLDQAQLQEGGATARLLEPATVLVQGSEISFDEIRLDIAGGTVTARGEAADTLDIAVSLDSVPLSIANAIRPDLSLGGTVSGTAEIGGSRDAPQISFDVTGTGITAEALREAGVASLDVDAQGRTADNMLSLRADVTSPGGLSARVEGSVPLDQDGQLALDVALQAFPLSLLNQRMPDLDLSGTLTGNAAITGTLADPRARFSLEASGLSARPLNEFGAGPIELSATGSFADGTVTLSTLEASGPSGLSVSASGRVPLGGGGLAVDLRGSVPLALGNRLLADRGTQLAGTLLADIRIGGSLENPSLSGSISTRDGAAVDPMTNLRLNDITLDAALQGDTVTIRSATAALAAGGTVTLSGTISTNAAAGFPADLTIRLDEARYVDGEMVSATISGTLALRGPLARDPLLSGELTVDRAEILVPENLGGGVEHIDVRHISPPPDVAATLRRARADDGTPVPGGRPSVLRLDVQLNAPARIFVRGRGLDAELGGSVRLTGPVTSIRPVGGFRLIRGRLSILGQRIVFDEGTVTLVGDLDPYLNFVARSTSGEITVFITVTGRVSDLNIDFSSQPELPEDEVLAQLIFKRGIGELSPLQLAQLAAAAAELAGGGDTSLLGSLRDAVGLDDLDVVTDTEGNTAVRAGRYIQENIYLGVEAGAKGSTRGTINLDITENLKARGAVGADGESSLGLFYEKDY